MQKLKPVSVYNTVTTHTLMNLKKQLRLYPYASILKITYNQLLL